MTKISTQQPSCAKTTEPEWVEMAIPLASIIQHEPLQVRKKLDAGAVEKYRARTKAGSTPPPIKVGKVNGLLYLVDGWHRIAAGALMFTGWGVSERDVCALVADMTEDQLRWEAARANMDHGVPLKTGEYRAVFRAFIRAKQHHKARGKFMSYRDMATALGVGVTHGTLYNWTRKDFPALARTLGGKDHGNLGAGAHEREIPTMEEEHAKEAEAALEALMQHAQALGNPESRWGLLKGLEVAADAFPPCQNDLHHLPLTI